MPWSEASPMDQRTQFIADHLRDLGSITELCARVPTDISTVDMCNPCPRTLLLPISPTVHFSSPNDCHARHTPPQAPNQARHAHNEWRKNQHGKPGQLTRCKGHGNDGNQRRISDQATR
jgi:hypothetical protein